MLTISGTSQHQAAVAGVAWLVEMQFTSGTIRYTTAPVTINDGTYDWTGLGNIVGVSAVGESEEVTGDSITLSMSIASTALIAASLGNVEYYRGQPVILYLQLLDETFKPVGTAVQRWVGLMDRVSIKRTQEGGGSIEMRCSRSGIARMRNSVGLRLTNEQQQARYAGDTGLQYVRTLIEQPSLWLSKEFQKI